MGNSTYFFSTDFYTVQNLRLILQLFSLRKLKIIFELTPGTPLKLWELENLEMVLCVCVVVVVGGGGRGVDFIFHKFFIFYTES